MKHVFVETNFLIAVARPDADPSAVGLLAKALNGTLVVHLPWCCRAEAARTLDAKINEDLGFERLMARRALRERAKDPELHKAVQRFAAVLREERRLAKADVAGSLDRVIASLQIIAPSEAVIARTLALSDTKLLKPFDEMILGAVLAKAAALHGMGERELFFCNLNKSDFSPHDRVESAVAEPRLEQAYRECGLTYVSHFNV